jgi:hypothetical protein
MAQQFDVAGQHKWPKAFMGSPLYENAIAKRKFAACGVLYIDRGFAILDEESPLIAAVVCDCGFEFDRQMLTGLGVAENVDCSDRRDWA